MSAPTSAIEAALLPFSDALAEPGVWPLACNTLAWCRAHGLFDMSCDAEEVVIAAVFAHLCSPEGATARHFEIAARFVAVFLNFDDAAPELVRAWVPAGQDWRPQERVPGYASWLASFAEHSRCAPRLAAHFDATFKDYVTSRREEVDVDRSTVTVERCWALRSRTTFNEPYVDYWLVVLDDDHDELWTPAMQECRRLATDMIWVLNDLTSLDKDIAGGRLSGDLNVVHCWSQREHRDLAAAVDRYVGIHNEMARRYREVSAHLRGKGVRAVDRCVALLDADVSGNRRAHETTLAVRYRAHALEVIARLERIDSRPEP